MNLVQSFEFPLTIASKCRSEASLLAGELTGSLPAPLVCGCTSMCLCLCMRIRAVHVSPPDVGEPHTCQVVIYVYFDINVWLVCIH